MRTWITRAEIVPGAIVQPHQIDIRDIARGLSNLCRYSGQTPHFYSVAEHSVLCSWRVKKEFALLALLHDASEAYMNDIHPDLKKICPAYVCEEKHLSSVIYQKFGVSHIDYAPVAYADKKLLELELESFKNPCDAFSLLQYYPPETAERIFLARANDLGVSPE